MLFNLPEVLTSMYNGMCLTPPRFSMVPDHMSQDIVDDTTIYANWEPLHLWTFQFVKRSFDLEEFEIFQQLTLFEIYCNSHVDSH